jgi:hypothetical protein
MLTFPSSPSDDVLILGAGFSKALSSAMPLTDELGDAVLPLIRERSRLPLPRRFRRGQFESWLSRLSEDQPDLNAAENLANRLLFQLASEALAAVLIDRVLASRDALLTSDSIRDLLGLMHIRRATAISFNQDTLVEIAATAGRYFSWTGRTPQSALPEISWWDVLNGQPQRPPTEWDAWRTLEPTFRLLKLHGSTHWYWQPGDTSGATVASWSPQGLYSSDPISAEETAAINRWLPGRAPLIVPPASSKSAFYRVPLLAQLWQDARKALLASKVRVSLLGYSIPVTDQVTSGMLKECLDGRRDIEIDVVNLRPRPVSKNVRALGVPGHRIHEVPTVDAFIAEYLDRSAAELVNAFRKLTDDPEESRLLVGSGLDGSLKVEGIALADDALELTLQPDDSPFTATNVSRAEGPSLVTLKDLLRVLAAGSSRRIVAVSQDGRRQLIVGSTELLSATGAGNGRWQVLLTTRSPGRQLNPGSHTLKMKLPEG